jgi:hypothetical protein
MIVSPIGLVHLQVQLGYAIRPEPANASDLECQPPVHKRFGGSLLGRAAEKLKIGQYRHCERGEAIQIVNGISERLADTATLRCKLAKASLLGREIGQGSSQFHPVGPAGPPDAKLAMTSAGFSPAC